MHIWSLACGVRSRPANEYTYIRQCKVDWIGIRTVLTEMNCNCYVRVALKFPWFATSKEPDVGRTARWPVIDPDKIALMTSLARKYDMKTIVRIYMVSRCPWWHRRRNVVIRPLLPPPLLLQSNGSGSSKCIAAMNLPYNPLQTRKSNHEYKYKFRN